MFWHKFDLDVMIFIVMFLLSFVFVANFAVEFVHVDAAILYVSLLFLS